MDFKLSGETDSEGEIRYQPRYLAYCALTGGGSPSATMSRDEKKYPGGKMAGFILWVGEQWREWEGIFGKVEMKSQEDYDRFDSWLQDKVMASKGNLVKKFQDAGRLEIIHIK